MSKPVKLPAIPVAFFGMVLGIAGLGNSWRVAHRLWGFSSLIGEGLMLIATVVWALLIILYIAKWVTARAEALTEIDHPIQCCFVGLIGVATMLIAGAALPYSRLAAEILFGLGAAFTFGFAVWRTGYLWQGGREAGVTTAVLYLPTVAGSFVTATIAAALGYQEWGELALGAGFFSWLAIESVLVHRLYTVTLPEPLRLQAFVLLRLMPWITQQSFAASYWAFTFGASALATTSLRMVEKGDQGAVATIAPYILFASSLLIGLIAIGTLIRIAHRRLLLVTPAQPSSPVAVKAA